MNKQLPTTSDLFGNQTFAPIMALTWNNPFATLMLHGKKETREWHTNHRGKVLICAAKKPLDEISLSLYSTEEQMNDMADIISSDETSELHGHAIGVGVLFNCRIMTPNDAKSCWVKYSPGLWIHEYRDVRRIKPFEFKGGQKWTVVKDQKILSQIHFI